MIKKSGERQLYPLYFESGGGWVGAMIRLNTLRTAARTLPEARISAE